MAKRRLTQEQLREEIEALVMEHMEQMEDALFDRFEVDCWDACLDGALWNKRMTKLAKMYKDAILFDRGFGVLEHKFKVKIAIDLTEDERVE
jgi:hypothetical protein